MNTDFAEEDVLSPPPPPSMNGKTGLNKKTITPKRLALERDRPIYLLLPHSQPTLVCCLLSRSRSCCTAWCGDMLKLCSRSPIK